MKKYKLITVSQTFTLKGLEKKANERQNEYAEKGWSGFLFLTLYILLEKI